jgi:hypothetical protein
MEIEKKLLAIFRMLEASYHHGGLERTTDVINKANAILTPKDKKVMADMAIAMILLTAGNQETVRDPSSYTRPGLNGMIKNLMRFGFKRTIDLLSLPVDTETLPSKQDYELAHKLLPYMGSSMVSSDDISSFAVDDEEGKIASSAAGYSQVYRGLKGVSKNVHKFLVSSPTWDMKRGVSTSRDLYQARKFAAVPMVSHPPTVAGPSVFFHIQNQSRRGFHAGEFSKYPAEQEIILSGDIQVDSWKYSALGTLKVSNGSIHTFRFDYDGKTGNGTLTDHSFNEIDYRPPGDPGENVKKFIDDGGFSFRSPNGDGTWTFSIIFENSFLDVKATLP